MCYKIEMQNKNAEKLNKKLDKLNIVFVQQQLGHSSMSTTINNYANGSIGMKDVLNAM